MKYFTHELISTANEWTEASESETTTAVRKFDRVAVQYTKELESLENRISKPAFEFFRYGFAETGLHDARLLSFKVGDGLTFAVDGSAPFRINHERLEAVVELLNYEQDRHYIFKLKGVSDVAVKLHSSIDSSTGSVGDLYTYELTGEDNDSLRIGLLFASGAEISVKFKKLVFRVNRIKKWV